MSWRDISLTWLCYQMHDGATILSGVASLVARARPSVTPEWLLWVKKCHNEPSHPLGPLLTMSAC
jgi:hypothetical protein